MIDRRAKERIAALLQRIGLFGASYRLLRSEFGVRLRSFVGAVHRPFVRFRLARHGNTVVNRAGHRLHLDPEDRRALGLFRSGGELNSGVIRLWSRLVSELEPDVLIDVGANYGEVLLSRDYQWGPDLLLVEPNPNVLLCLERSVAEYPAPARVVAAAASDASGVLWLDVPDGGSGLGSIRERGARGDYAVPVVTVDSLVDIRHVSTLLAKIDVEGHELAVLRGMEKLLTSSSDFGVIVEFGHLDDEALHYMSSKFRVSTIDRFTLEATLVGYDELVTARRSKATTLLGDLLLRPRL